MQKETHKISIVIPVYNVEKYLRECLDSILNQTLTDIEIICINDGSTDNSLQILEKYASKDERIKIINQENKGLACARNTGINNATGKYIFFLDSDDYLLPNIIDKLYDEAQIYDVDILMSKCKAFADNDSNNDYTNKRVADLNKYLDYKEASNIKVTKENFITVINNYPCVSCGSLYKLDFLNKNDLRFIDKKVIHEDNGFFLKTFSMLPRVTFLNIDSIMYRVRFNSISYESCKKENKNKQDEQLKIIIQDALNYIRDHSAYNSKKIIADIKVSDKYYIYFIYALKGVYTYCWGRNNKRIKLFGFPIYREKIRNQKRIIKLLGIPIYIADAKQETL